MSQQICSEQEENFDSSSLKIKEEEDQRPKSARLIVGLKSNSMEKSLKMYDGSSPNQADILAMIKQSKVIIAENAPINMQVLQNQLFEVGEHDRCIFAYDGKEALE